MTSFDLLDLIGQVDERHLEPSFPQKRRVRWKRWGALAACLVLAVGAAVLWNPEPGPQLQSRPGTDVSIPGTPAQEPVDVKDLLYGLREGEYSNQVLTINQISLGDNTAEYHKLEVRSQVDLRDYLGEALEEVSGWYRLRGHEDLQYLIGPDGDGELALWEFAYFVPEEGETYSYRTVLEDIYHIFSAEDMAQITVSPGNMDNTDEGKAAQAEIGTCVITHREDIAALYEAMASAECLGPNLWDEIRWGHQSDHNLVQAVRNTRYLTIETADGRTMDHLKYTAGGHQFYEYSGVAYVPLEEETARRVERILGIS